MFIEADMWDPSCSSSLNISKAAGDRKKKANSQKLGVKNKSKKGKVYRSKVAGDPKKKASSQKLGVKK